MSAKQTIRVLLVEDTEEDATWIKLILKKAENVDFTIDHIDWLSNALTAMANKNYDVVLLDLGLPDSRGLETLKEFQKVAGTTPVIVLTGHDEMQLAMDCMEEGAQDFQLKNEVKTRPLERAIVYAMKRRHHEIVGRSLMNASLAQLSESDITESPKMAMVRDHIQRIPEALDEVIGYLRINAPHAVEDVNSILEAHQTKAVLKEVSELSKPKAPRSSRGHKGSVTDLAHKALSRISSSKEKAVRPSSATSPPVARETLLEAIEELSAPIEESDG